MNARPVDPGEPAQITLKFMTPTDLDIDQFITFVVEDDMGVPSTINPNTVSITGMGTEDHRFPDRGRPMGSSLRKTRMLRPTR